MNLWGEALSGRVGDIPLFWLWGLRFAFEFVNGFHDTANAVATVIYTHSLPPYVAVVWSGIWNLIGVLTSTGAVAYRDRRPPAGRTGHQHRVERRFRDGLRAAALRDHLEPRHLVPRPSGLQLPHLIGSIMGVGLANSLMAAAMSSARASTGARPENIGLSLIISPVVGFGCAALLLLLAKALIKRPGTVRRPRGDKPPPLWIRGLLWPTCTGVSFSPRLQ